MKVGLIGQGFMGAGMAQRLLDCDIDLVVFDVVRSSCGPAESRGAAVADSIPALSGLCDLVVASLPNPEATALALWDDEAGALGAMRPGTVLVDCSTNDFATTKGTATRCESRRIHFVDCPVSQGGGTAAEGKLTLMVGATDTTLERAAPLLTKLGSIHHLGPVGTGTVAKLLTQYVGFTSAVLMLEAAAAAERAGISIRALLDLVPYSAAAGGLVTATLASAASGAFDSDGQAWAPLYIVRKDLHEAVALTKEMGATEAFGAEAVSLLDEADALGWQQSSFTKVIELLRARMLSN